MRESKNLRVQRVDQMARIFTFQYQITEKCNLRCTHCYEDGAITHDASLEELVMMLDKFLRTAEKWKRLPVVPLSGGEPLVSPNFWPLLDHLETYGETKNVLASILSNGTLIDKKVAEALSNYKVLEFVQISLDGVTPETHEDIRGKGTFKKSVRAITNLVDAGVPVHIHFVVHKNNYEEAFQVTDLAAELGVNSVLVTRLVPFGRGKEMEELMLSPAQVKTLYTKLGEDADAAVTFLEGGQGVFVNRLRCDWPVICTGGCFTSVMDVINKNGSHCQVGRSYIAVMSDGTCYACRRMPINVGNLLTQSFEEMWNHPFLWKMRKKNAYMKEKCQKCPFNTDPRLNFTCMGGASCISYGYYDDPFMPDPQCSFDPETEAEDLLSKVDNLYEEYKTKKGVANIGNT